MTMMSHMTRCLDINTDMLPEKKIIGTKYESYEIYRELFTNLAY